MRLTKILALGFGLSLTSVLGYGSVAQAGNHDCEHKTGKGKPAAEMPAAEMPPVGAPPVETPAAEPTDDEAAMMAPTVVDIAASNEAFSTLVAAVSAADLVETLSGEGPFTVFAPTNDAFAALPEGVLESLLLPENKDLLTKILTYHVVSGNVLSTDLAEGAVPTVEGNDVMISLEDEGGIKVNDANVVMADIEASNGVVHVIDTVILPPDLVAQAGATGAAEASAEVEAEAAATEDAEADLEAEVTAEGTVDAAL
ncbi:fasciclin domain-containing protein [Synechococcus moorigangaii CMS01]|nr:fasciclin domain-containing protein [Synechococcus moorigangaii CMS01]